MMTILSSEAVLTSMFRPRFAKSVSRAAGSGGVHHLAYNLNVAKGSAIRRPQLIIKKRLASQ
jgi:hypothetical protein